MMSARPGKRHFHLWTNGFVAVAVTAFLLACFLGIDSSMAFPIHRPTGKTTTVLLDRFGRRNVKEQVEYRMKPLSLTPSSPKGEPQKTRTTMGQNIVPPPLREPASPPLQLFKSSTANDITAIPEDEVDTFPKGTAGLGVFGLLLFGGVSYFLQYFLNEQCLADANMCQITEFSQFYQDHGFAAFMLILTHAFPFVLIPVTMRFVSDKSPLIKANHPEFNPFIMQLGLATICFGLALEFGWHVTSAWYYVNNFHVLNFGFYFFLISSFALWADGFKNTVKMDTVFGVILLIATILYPLGNYQVLHPDNTPILPFLAKPDSAKIPLYLGLTVTFTTLTARGREVFGNKMFLVFFLSVVVNLFFIFKLQSLPTDELTVWNYIYHVCHDLLGTEAGVAYFAYLVATYDGTEITD